MGDGTQKSSPQPTANWTPLTETKWFQWSIRILRWGGYAFLSCVAVLLLGYLVLKSQPLPQPNQPLTTRIYSADETLIDELHQGEKRQYVPLEEIPSTLVNATIAIEDKDFYKHFGISPRGIIRAAWANLKAGDIVEGASTITQQLARNLYIHHDRTWSRKLKEMKYALQLEIHYSKDEILEMYLNEIYFGHKAYGVGQAARMFFGKKPQDLTVAECALLAGIPKGAGVYSPYLHPDNAKDRQRVVLRAMQQAGHLTEEEVQQIAKESLHYQPQQNAETKTVAPYFRDFVKTIAMHRHGLTREQVESGGLSIYTTLDLDLQKKAEKAVQSQIGNKSELQAALLAVDPHDGSIKAMVGGKDYSTSQYNRTLAKRQPGSAFKPFLYLAALEDGLTPVTMLTSEPTTFTFGNDETYRPQNFHNQYANDSITMREALVRSDNVYAVKTHFQIGRDRLVETASKLGIKETLEPHPSLALGTIPVSPLEMAEAYTTIARQGSHIPLTAITRIEDKTGEVLFEAEPTSEQVVSAATSFVLTHMMEGVFDDAGGTGQMVRQLVSRPIAGKTGTTDWDSWLVGFDPQLVTAVWVGHDQNTPLTTDESRVAKWVWGNFMQQAQPGHPGRVFRVPDGVSAAYIDPTTGLLATEDCPAPYMEYFLNGTVPQQTCQVHGKNAEPMSVGEEEGDESSWLDKLKKWWNNP